MYIPLDQQQHIFRSVQDMARAVLHVNLVRTHIIGPRHGLRAVKLCEIVVPISRKLFRCKADGCKRILM